MASNGRFSQVQAPNRVVHSNLEQEVIQITEDKLRLVLNEHLAHCEQRKAWIAPLGIVITIITVFAASSFKDAFFKSETWEAAFLISGLLCTGWLVWAIVHAWKSPSVGDVIEKVKNRSAGK